MTPDKTPGLLDRVGDAVLEPVARDGGWGPTICISLFMIAVFVGAIWI